METLMNSHFTDESLNWRTLCRAAAVEQNPDALAQIVHRIILALKLRQRVLPSFAQARRAKSWKFGIVSLCFPRSAWIRAISAQAATSRQRFRCSLESKMPSD
jgi:hypothetical protein